MVRLSRPWPEKPKFLKAFQWLDPKKLEIWVKGTGLTQNLGQKSPHYYLSTYSCQHSFWMTLQGITPQKVITSSSKNFGGGLKNPDKTLKIELIPISIFKILGVLGPKIPKIYINPIPKKSPKIFLGIFGDKTPRNPEIEVIPVPKKSPKFFGGFSGIKPQKTPKLKSSPSPKNPQKFFGDFRG